MNYNNLDILFIHPPANINDASHTLDADVGYTNQFVAIPMGFFSMANRLDKAGYATKILNLGERVYIDKKTPIQEHIENILSIHAPRIVGMDVHWMIHAAGAMECARLIKKLSKDTHIVLGGISASFFAKEILQNYPQIDYVMVGECDEAIVDFLQEKMGTHPKLENVPNLVYRDGESIVFNDVKPPDISHDMDLTRYDLLIDAPVINPDRANISFFRGCYRNCCFCAGSREAYTRIMKRNGLGVINPEVLVDIMRKNLEKDRRNIYIYGDIRYCGSGYAQRFFEALYQSGMTNAHIVFELFELATEDYIQQWSQWARDTGNSLEVTHSPESGNIDIRRQFGKGYSNKQLLEHCQLLIDYNIPQSIYFLLGLPNQTRDTIEDTLEISNEIIRVFAEKFQISDLRHEIVSFNFMQIPDAGSTIFQNSKKFGYNFEFKNIKSLVEKLQNSQYWWQSVGYHTDTMSKNELIRSFYHIQISLLRMYHAYNFISDQQLEQRLDKYMEDKKIYERALHDGYSIR